MDKILHDPEDTKLWELWYIPSYGHAGFCPSAVELCELRVWVEGFYGAVESALDGFCSNRGLMGCIWVSGV